MGRVLVVTANPLLDLLAPKQLIPGQITRSPAFQPMAAGKGINVARVLQKHGHQCDSIFFAGGQTGSMLEDLIAEDGVNPIRIPTQARMRIGMICAADDERPQGSLLENGFMLTKEEVDMMAQAVQRSLGEQDLVIVSGSVPHPLANNLYRTLCTMCNQAGVEIWVDSYGDAMNKTLTGEHPPYLAKPNREELNSSTHWQRVSELHITDGPGHTEIRGPAGRFELIPPQIDEINPVGCGDCYVAGLAHGKLEAWEYQKRVAYAAACGAANAERWDVAMIEPGPVINRLADQAQVKALP